MLIVDDDQVLANEQAIAGGLAALGIPYAIAKAHPSAKLMSKYAAVVWEASVDRYEGQLDKYDRAALRSYLNGGGRLLITSNRIFDAVGRLAIAAVDRGGRAVRRRSTSACASRRATRPTS